LGPVTAGHRGRVCLHAPHLYPLFSEGRIPFAGGAETQQAAIARGLATLGFEVTAVTCDYGQPERITVDGVTLLRSFRPEAGWPILRMFHPRLSRSLRALSAADADLYYSRGAGFWAGVTFEVARRRGAAFVFAAAHDHDTAAKSPLIGLRDRWIYRRALRGADLVTAQTEWQQHAFEHHLGRTSDVVPNLVAIPVAPPPAGRDGAILWLSTYKASKRPDWFVELARRLPSQQFIMCGVVPPPPLPPVEWERARSAARTIPNLEVRGPVEHSRISALMAEASLFVHTSPVEGFANTLLEAWAYRLPTIVCADPDGVVARRKIGEVASDVDAMTAAVSRWTAEAALRREAGERALAYVRERHAPRVVLEQLAGAFDRLIAARSRRAR
jgi:glycosyltransferase involved in cell wall biosynthesis